MDELREEVASALFELARREEEGGAGFYDEMAADAISVVRARVEAIPCDGKDSALGYRHEVLAALGGES
jgi:hypothetical protein